MADNINESLNIASDIVNATTNTDTSNKTDEEINSDTMPTEVSNVSSTIPNAEDVTTSTETLKTASETLSSTTKSTPITTSSGTKANASYLKQLYTENPTLYGYATKQGYSVYNWNGQVYINNTPVDWRSLNLKQDASNNVIGTQAQYDQLLKNITEAGYTSAKAFSPYMTSTGHTLTHASGNVWYLDGKLIDFSQYANLGMKVVNNAWVGPETAYKQILKEVEERSNYTLDQYVAKQGMAYVKDTNKDYPGQYINNLYVSDATLKGYNLSTVSGKIVGSQENYNKLIKDIKNMGYTSNLSLQQYVQPILGAFEHLEGTSWKIGGKVVDFSNYADLKVENGTWRGSETAYKQLIADLQSQSRTDMNTYLKSKGINIAVKNGQLFINNRGMTTAELKALGIKGAGGYWWGSESAYNAVSNFVKDEGYTSNLPLSQYFKNKNASLKHVSKNIWRVNGQLMDFSKYGMNIIDNAWVGSETAYKQILNDALNRAPSDFVKAAQSIGMRYSVVDGNMRINSMPLTTELLNKYGIYGIEGKWYGTQSGYKQLMQYIKDQGYTSNTVLATYLKNNGFGVPKRVSGNVWTVDGKYIDFSSKEFKDLGLTYSTTFGWDGSETAYKKIMEVLNAQSPDTFEIYAQKQGFNYEVKDGKYYVNGYLVDSSTINKAGVKILAGQLVGTEDQYIDLIKKIEEPYTYKSALEDEIQNALDQINDFQQYQTPQETLDLINNLMASVQENFEYDPTEDSALITAQKEAERVVRETKGARNLLYSSGTIEQVAQKAAELIPEFEQAAYQRFADEKNRALNLISTVMQWDEMQNDRNMDELTLLQTKFNTIMDMDSRSLDQFQVMLEQRNADREAALAQQQYDLDKKTAEIESAWERVNATGTVSKADSVILGVPVGTKASWLQQIELQQKYALNNLKIEYQYAIKLQKSQKEIEAAMIKYKAALDYASSQKLQSTEYANELKLQQKEYANQLKLLNSKSSSGGTTSYSVAASYHALTRSTGNSTINYYINKYAKQYGIDANLVYAVMKQESGFHTSAKSSAGAIGLMQLMPGTAAGMGVNPYNMAENIKGGVQYLATYLKKWGSIEKALISYNAGPGRANYAYSKLPKETQNYIKSVLAIYAS